ncbi:MAG: DUF4190 domain-containing protein [Phycisphaeraceae bacterium]
MTQHPSPQPHPMPSPATPAETSGKAIASLVCSLAGFMVCFFIGQIIGIVLGHQALNEIRASQGRLSGEGLAKAGIILGWVFLAIDVLMVLGVGMMFLLFMVSSPTSAPVPYSI